METYPPKRKPLYRLALILVALGLVGGIVLTNTHPVKAAISLVGERAVIAASTTAFSPSSNTTQGDHLILIFGNTGNFVISSVSDTKSNTWQVDATIANSSFAATSIASVYLSTALTTSDTITITLSGAGTGRGGLLEEFSGLATTSWFDKTANNTGANSNSLTTGTTATTSQASEVAIEGAVVQASGLTFTPDATYSTFTTTNFNRGGGAYKILSSTGTQSASGSFSGTATNWSAAIATYKAAGASNSAPAAPTLVSPADTSTGAAALPTFTLRTTDADNDYLRYEIQVCSTSNCSSVVRTICQDANLPNSCSASQTGWSGQDQSSSTAYTGNSTITSSTLATHAYQATGLSSGTQYWWRAYAIDPAGSNTASSASSIFSFTTTSSADHVLIQGGSFVQGGTVVQ